MKACRSGAAAAAVVALALYTPALSAQCDACVFPGAQWDTLPRAELSANGWSLDGWRSLRLHLRDGSNATGVLVVDRGRVVLEFGDVEELTYLASVRKSILAMLYGAWVEDGTIDLDTTLEEIGVDDIGGLLPIEKRATIRHLVTARSGVYHAASNSGDNLADAPPRGSQEPGTYMLYNNWDFNAAGAVFEELTGREYLRRARAPAGPAARVRGLGSLGAAEDRRPERLSKSGLPHVDLHARHGEDRPSHAERGPLGRTPGPLGVVGARDREARHTARGDESLETKGRLLRLRLHVVGLGRPRSERTVRGRLHRSGPIRAVDHHLSGSRPGRRSQDERRIPPIHVLGIVAADDRADPRGQGRGAAGPLSLGMTERPRATPGAPRAG